MAVKIPQLEIDGVLCDVYDSDAIHTDDLADILSQASIRYVIGNLFFPVGSYYITESATDPATLFGGTWESVGGRVLMGADGNHPVNSVGGSEDAIVPTHRHFINAHTAVNGEHVHSISGTAASAGAHTHGLGERWSEGSGKQTAFMRTQNRDRQTIYTASAGAHTHGVTGSAAIAGNHSHLISAYSDNAGESGVGKNNMPYRAVYIWRRTA